jgi:hypothetical protein
MADQIIGRPEEKPARRFTSYDEFLKEFYPKSTEHKAHENAQDEEDFGVELALDSLSRHANLLRFGDV